MATTNVIYQIQDHNQITLFDLHDYQIASSWRITPPLNGRITETMQLLFQGGPTTTRQIYNDLKDQLNTAIEYHTDPLLSDHRFLAIASPGETQKRALIYAYALTPVITHNSSPHLIGRTNRWNLAITRHELFEDTGTATLITNLTNTVLAGGVYNQLADTGGTRHSRIEAMNFKKEAAGTTIERLWCGIKRDNGYGTATNFNPIMECENETTRDTDSSQQTITGASGGDVIQTSFTADATLITRFTLKLGDHAADALAHLGRFRAILRYQIDAASTDIALRLRTAWDTTLPLIQSRIGETIYISAVNNTKWYLQDLGEISIPDTNYRQKWKETLGIEGLDDFTIALDAGRLTGSGKLNADCIYLIPADHMIAVDGLSMKTLTPYVYTFTAPEDETVIYNLETASPAVATTPNFTATNWIWPKDGGNVVVLGDQGKVVGHLLADSLTSIQIQHIKRWDGYHA